MSLFRSLLAAASLLGAAPFAITGCGASDSVDDRLSSAAQMAIPARHNTVIADGCALEPWQKQVLASPSGQRVIQDVVLLCFIPRFDGTVSPADPSAKNALAAEAQSLRARGYKVRIGVSFTDETGGKYDGNQTAQRLAAPEWRSAVIAELQARSSAFDGLELDFQSLPNGARDAVGQFVEELAPKIRPLKSLGVFLPPSVTLPSDLPGGDAFDVARLSRSADDLRVMTLDFSCCGAGAGPTIESGWAVDAVRLARSQAGGARISVAYPLYGVDFSRAGERLVTYLEAKGLAALHGLTPARGPTGTPNFRYLDPNGESHELWYDDSESILRTLRAWGPEVFPIDVGVVFYGLGAEDPILWREMARGLP
ncbi:hypothetical protein [Pendulispora albinea]|uniref:Chitinase n=1 Tax=Pendulispora albinea TaxID=2741071 RepID=A0ABZ2LW54_9BACT